jgi:hypothetical protein
MADVPRISVEEARRKAAAGQALLVCAYPDDVKCSRVKLEGSITLADLQARLRSVSRDQELIFFCA